MCSLTRRDGVLRRRDERAGVVMTSTIRERNDGKTKREFN